MTLTIEGKEVSVKDLTLDQWRSFMALFLSRNPHAGQAWDVMTALRGPDFPSERQDQSASEQSDSYRKRRNRKYDTVEIIRSAAFFGVVGGAARSHSDNHVRLPPVRQWDHFDRHVERAASVLGLEVRKRSE